MPAPVMMSSPEAAKYIRVKYGLKYSRQTISIWMKKGYRNDTLKSKQCPCQRGRGHGGRYDVILRTCDHWIDEFMLRVHRELLEQSGYAFEDYPGRDNKNPPVGQGG